MNEFTPKKKPKLAETVAARIKQDIVDRGWPVGEVLGSEPELIERYGVSRATVREAIRQIERHGLAQMRRGVNGGLVISKPARAAAEFAIASYIELIGVSLPELFEAREILELQIVALACKRIRDDEVPALRKAAAEFLAGDIDDLDGEVERYLGMRAAITRLAHNPAALLLINSITHAIINCYPPTRRLAARKKAVKDTRKILTDMANAIISGDVLSAQLAVRRDIELAHQNLERQLKGASKPTDSDLAKGAFHIPSSVGNFRKLGYRTSVKLCHDILNSGLQPGAHIGSEPELQEKYGISRAVFREAIRLLECHNIVTMRHGRHGGGLVVGIPDPAYTVDLVANYFQNTKLKTLDFYEVWRSLQISCADLAAKNFNSKSDSVRLDNVLELESKAPRSKLLQQMVFLDTLLGDLSRNRALSILNRVLNRVAISFPAEPPTTKACDELKLVHRNIANAVKRKDSELARRETLKRMQLNDLLYGEQKPKNSKGS